MWRNVRFLASQELRKYPLAGALTALFFAVAGVMLGGLFLSSRREGEDALTRFIVHADTDWVLMCLVITLSYVFTKDCWTFHRTDVYSRRLAFYRKLPVADRDILLSRYLLMGLSLIPMSLCLYLPAYYIVRAESPIDGLSFLAAVTVWTGLSLLAGAGYIHLELGFPGKWYFKINLLLVFLLLVLIVLLSSEGIYIMEGTFGLVERYGFYPGLISLLAAAGGIIGIFRLTLRRISTRDLL